MKSFINYFRLTLIIAALFAVYSCENNKSDNAGSGTMEFALSIQDQDAKGDTGTTNTSYHILISVVDKDNKEVFTDKLIPLYVFGNGFVSENVEIRAGEFILTKFMVINASGAVVFASPVVGSPLAYLTTKPLPFHFSIAPGQTTRVVPEVLHVGDNGPDRFGYANFGVSIIKPLEFWAMCVLDPGNPLIMAPIQITSAKVTVQAPDGWHYSFMLEPKINHLVIRGGYTIYTFIIQKEGFLPVKLEFTADQLLYSSPENPLILKISWYSQMQKLVLKPGPREGKDAMISNLNPDKNFAEHKYFEATFLSEPILTVMRSNRSLIAFNLEAIPKSASVKKALLHLTYDIPIPFDSTIVVPFPGDSSYINNNTRPAGFVGGVLQQIVEPWDEYKVTWNNQPKTIEANQVYIPPFIRNVNFIEVDVTRLIVPLAEISAPNYGMLFRLSPDNSFPGFRFGSSDHPELSMKPELIIYYTVP